MGEGVQLIEHGFLPCACRVGGWSCLSPASCGLFGFSWRRWRGGLRLARCVVEGCAGVADEDANEVNPSPITPERGHQGVVLIGFYLELLVAADVPSEADLEEHEGAVLGIQGVDFRGRVDRHSSGVDDVAGPPPLRLPSSCLGLLAVVPKPECTGGPSCFLRHVSQLPLVRGGSSCLWTRRIGDSCAVWARCARGRLARPCWAGVFGW